MKKIFFLLITLFNANVLSSHLDFGINKNWIYIDVKFSETGFRDIWMRDVDFTDSLHGMIAGSGEYDVDPCIIKTEDGGYSWYPYWKHLSETIWDSVTKKFNSFFPQSIYKIQYIDSNSIFGITDNSYQTPSTRSYIMKSTDSGKNWNYTYLDSHNCGYTIKMLNKKSGYCIASNALYNTNDSGNNWSKIKIGMIDSSKDDVGIIDMSIVEDSIIYLLMLNQIWNNDKSHIIHFFPFMIKSEDNCKTWKRTEFPDTNFRRFCFTDRNTGFSCTQSKYIDSLNNKTFYDRIYQTTDGGETWFIRMENLNVNLKRKTVHLKDGYPMNIKFYDKLNGIAYGYFSNLYLTTNGGITWEDQIEYFIPDSTIPAAFSSAGYAGAKDKIVVGTCLHNYAVLVYSPNRTSVSDELSKSCLKLTPNPATDFLEISVGTNGVRPEQNIEIFSVLGVKLKQIENGELKIENDKIRIDVSSLTTGLYFVKVGTHVGKFVKI